MYHWIAKDWLNANAESLQDYFQGANTFSHFVMEELVPKGSLSALMESFPTPRLVRLGECQSRAPVLEVSQ